MKKLVCLALPCAMIVSGCASRAENITAAYVSPVGYQNLTCDQLALEATAISARAQTAVGAQNQRATGDAVAMTVGLVVFWPALFFMRGDGAPAAEVSRMKGEMDAMEMVSRQKGCNIQFQREAPKPKPAVVTAQGRG